MKLDLEARLASCGSFISRLGQGDVHQTERPRRTDLYRRTSFIPEGIYMCRATLVCRPHPPQIWSSLSPNREPNRHPRAIPQLTETFARSPREGVDLRLRRWTNPRYAHLSARPSRELVPILPWGRLTSHRQGYGPTRRRWIPPSGGFTIQREVGRGYGCHVFEKRD